MLKVILVLLCGFLSCLTAFAQEKTIATEAEIARSARDLLSEDSNSAGFQTAEECTLTKVRGKKKRSKVCEIKIASFNVVLAVKRDDDSSFVVIKADGKTGKSKTDSFITSCEFDKRGKTNGVGTKFTVVSPEGYKVYAIRRVTGEHGVFREMVNTPASPVFLVQAVIEDGAAYIDEIISRAKEELTSLGVVSRVLTDTPVSNYVSSATVHRIAIDEHVDHNRFKKEGIEAPASDVYIIFALNREKAYQFANSSAGARGPWQFTPKTYFMIRRFYPKANLDPDFEKGANDLVNVAKAAILLIDYNMTFFPKKIGVESVHEDYSAGSYNGGPGRMCFLLRKGRDLVKANTNPENKVYIAKIRALREVKAFWLHLKKS